MSQLIQLKQRIKAIQSIKKITQTMKLIAMSSHSKLKKQAESLHNFEQQIAQLIHAINLNQAYPKNETSNKTLFIIFAAEKGLCGNFNTMMFQAFDQHLKHKNTKNFDIISIGKKASLYAEEKNWNIIHRFDQVLPSQLEKIAQNLYELIHKIQDDYKSIETIYSKARTFFHQEALLELLIPLQQQERSQETLTLHHYEWIQTQQEVNTALFKILLKTKLLFIISQSMLSEQSARFLSMNNASNSATTLLKEMKGTFNKLRQAKITRELIELSSNF